MVSTRKTKRFRNADLKTPPKRRKLASKLASKLPNLPFELIIHILSYLHWQEISHLYGFLPLSIVDTVLVQTLREANFDKDTPLLRLFSDSSCITRGQRLDLWLRFSSFDPASRILWLVPDASLSRNFFKLSIDHRWSFDNVDTEHPRYPVHGDFILKIVRDPPMILKRIGRFVDVLPAVKRVNIKTSDFKHEHLKGERVRLCGAHYMMEGYATPCLLNMPIPDTVMSSIEDYALLDDQAHYNSLLEEQRLASGSSSISSIITEAHEAPTHPNGRAFPPPTRRTFPASIYSSRDYWLLHDYIGALFIDRIALPLQTFFQFLQTEPRVGPLSGRPPLRDPTGITTLFPRRLAFVRQRVEEVYPDFPTRELVRTFLTSRMIKPLESAPNSVGEGMTRAEMYLVLFREEVMDVQNAEELGEKAVKKAGRLMATLKSIKKELKKLQ